MPTNVETLQAAGVLSTPTPIDPSQEAFINGLPSSDVDAIISIYDRCKTQQDQDPEFTLFSDDPGPSSGII